jgi:hypothetical protein
MIQNGDKRPETDGAMIFDGWGFVPRTGQKPGVDQVKEAAAPAIASVNP